MIIVFGSNNHDCSMELSLTRQLITTTEGTPATLLSKVELSSGSGIKLSE